MVGAEPLLVTLVRPVDRIPTPPPPAPPGRGSPRFYPDQLFLKALVIMIVRHLHTAHELLAVLSQPTAEIEALRGLLTHDGRFPCRRTWARRLGSPARGLEPWETTRLEAPGRPPIDVTATPCRHGPPLSHPLVGDVVGFALRWDGQERGALWISGDTVLYDGVRAVAGRLQVDVALLHLGGVRFPVTGPLRYTMTGRDAVDLCRLVRPRVAIPVHYEGWAHFRDGRAAVERALTSAPDVASRVRWLPIGEAVEIES